MFFFPFLCSAIPDLDLGILKMLIRVCFHDVLQPGVYVLHFSVIKLFVHSVEPGTSEKVLQ